MLGHQHEIENEKLEQVQHHVKRVVATRSISCPVIAHFILHELVAHISLFKFAGFSILISSRAC